jgi:hypothetical protein
MKHNLFLVHGMGVHETDSWVDDVKEKLQEVAGRYEYFDGVDLEDRINFLPISYDEKLAELLTLWKENTSEMQSFLNDQELDPGLNIPTVLGWLDNADEKEKNLFWSHVSDVLVYRFFLTYQASIRASVALQFVEGINWIKENNPDNQGSTVVAHSLGNIVAHDALHMLGTNQFDDIQAFEPEDWTFQNLFSLANVCRIMQTDFDPYESIIRPVSAGGDAYYYYFINAYHELDPFTLACRFAPDNWSEGYLDLTLSHFHHWNIHGFNHFLDHPRVHIPLLKSITSMDCISQQEMQTAYNKYEESKRFGGKLKCIGDVQSIVEDELKPLAEGIGSEMDLQQLVPNLLEAYKIYDKIKDVVEECDEIV